jgi:hypothetical protein
MQTCNWVLAELLQLLEALLLAMIMGWSGIVMLRSLSVKINISMNNAYVI